MVSERHIKAASCVLPYRGSAHRQAQLQLALIGYVRAQNSLAILPMLAITVLSGEAQSLVNLKWKASGIIALTASCAGGLGMSYFSFALRAVISATSFSVIGNVCKVLTILVNLLVWDKHSSKSHPYLPQ
jgi:GDP-mannose transporter